MIKPLRPIDAVFVHPEGRFYVIYYRGELWQLPKLKLNFAAWQRKKPYLGDKGALYLSRKQAATDLNIAKTLRTLNLPQAIAGSSLPKFESWWEAHGFFWLQDHLTRGESPLAADNPELRAVLTDRNQPTERAIEKVKAQTTNNLPNTDNIFAEMLADLTAEVLYHHEPL